MAWVTSEEIRIKRWTNLASLSAQSLWSSDRCPHSYPEGSRRWGRSKRPMWTAVSNDIRMFEVPSSSLAFSPVLVQPCPLRSSSFLRTKRCGQESPWSCSVKWQAPSPSHAPGWSSASRSVMEGSGLRKTHTARRPKEWEMLWRRQYRSLSQEP